MIMKSNFELIEIADEHMAVPVGEKADSFQGIVALTEAAYFLLNNLKTPQTKESLLKILIDAYDVDPLAAQTDLENLFSTLFDLGMIEE